MGWVEWLASCFGVVLLRVMRASEEGGKGRSECWFLSACRVVRAVHSFFLLCGFVVYCCLCVFSVHVPTFSLTWRRWRGFFRVVRSLFAFSWSLSPVVAVCCNDWATRSAGWFVHVRLATVVIHHTAS